MYRLIETTLEFQENCPKCGCSWQALEGMLYETLYSDNREVALTIIRNCDVCQARFKKQTEGEL